MINLKPFVNESRLKGKALSELRDESRRYVCLITKNGEIEADKLFGPKINEAEKAYLESEKILCENIIENRRLTSLADTRYPAVKEPVVQWAWNPELEKYEICGYGTIEIWERGHLKPKQFKEPTVGIKYIRKNHRDGKPSLVIYKVCELEFRTLYRKWCNVNNTRTLRVWRKNGVNPNNEKTN